MDQGGRGLRQGYPLLFVLCLEYFSRLLRLKTGVPDFNYHPGLLKVTRVCGRLATLVQRGRRLASFCRDARVCFKAKFSVNVLKSTLYTAGIGGLEEIQALTQIPRGSMPFWYLGIPLAAEKLKVRVRTTRYLKGRPRNVWKHLHMFHFMTHYACCIKGSSHSHVFLSPKCSRLWRRISTDVISTLAIRIKSSAKARCVSFRLVGW